MGYVVTLGHGELAGDIFLEGLVHFEAEEFEFDWVAVVHHVNYRVKNGGRGWVI